MKRLYILRHAKAAPGGARTCDEDRPLNERGERDAPDMGRRLAARAGRPDAVVASPARRTVETARLVAREVGFPAGDIGLEARVYEAGLATLLDVVRETGDGVASLLLVGHNPGLSELAQALVPGFTEELPTSGLVAVDLPVGRWSRVGPGAGRLAWLASPRRWR